MNIPGRSAGTNDFAGPPMTRFWHGFADMHAVRRNEVVMQSGAGAWLEDTKGNRYLDATAGLWYCGIGHGRAEVAEATAKQMRSLAAYSSFGRYTTDVTLRLSDHLSSMAPMADAVVFLGSGGSDAIDTAVKLARGYWQLVGEPARQWIVTREHSYHGMHVLGTSMSGISALRAGYGKPFVDEVLTVGAMDTEALALLFRDRGHEIAAFVGEPVIGAGGVVPPEDGYWSEVQRLCREYGVLLVADETITGFGRLGSAWGCQRFGIEPDLVTFAKTVTSGYIPLGGVLVGRRVAGPYWDELGTTFRHGYTYSGHSAACAAALANLAIIEREGLVDGVAGLEPTLRTALLRLTSVPLVGEVRTIGLMGAVALDPEAISRRPSVVEDVVGAALGYGVATRVLRGHAIHISPPFVITADEIDFMVGGLESALREVANELQ